MPEVIHESQTTYTPGRYVHDNLLSFKSERIKGLMTGLDARKAFDSVDHNYMQGVLEPYGFGSKFKNWFKLLNKNLKAIK